MGKSVCPMVQLWASPQWAKISYSGSTKKRSIARNPRKAASSLWSCKREIPGTLEWSCNTRLELAGHGVFKPRNRSWSDIVGRPLRQKSHTCSFILVDHLTLWAWWKCQWMLASAKLLAIDNSIRCRVGWGNLNEEKISTFADNYLDNYRNHIQQNNIVKKV